MIEENEVLKKRIIKILDEQISLKQKSMFLRSMLLSEKDTIEKRARLLNHIRDAIT